MPHCCWKEACCVRALGLFFFFVIKKAFHFLFFSLRFSTILVGSVLMHSLLSVLNQARKYLSSMCSKKCWWVNIGECFLTKKSRTSRFLQVWSFMMSKQYKVLLFLSYLMFDRNEIEREKTQGFRRYFVQTAHSSKCLKSLSDYNFLLFVMGLVVFVTRRTKKQTQS